MTETVDQAKGRQNKEMMALLDTEKSYEKSRLDRINAAKNDDEKAKLAKENEQAKA